MPAPATKLWPLCVLWIGACACSATDSAEPDPGVGGASGAGGGGGSAGSAGTAGQGGVGATGGSSGSAGAAASGGSAGTAASGGSGGSPCGSSNDCSSAVDLGALSGDNGGVVTHDATGSRFLKLRVTEDSHNVLGEALELKVGLQVPSGADIDVYAYLDPNSDVSPCGQLAFATAEVGGTGQNEQLTLKWGDGLTGSGDDDSRTVVIELAHKSGACEPWKLTIQGDP